MLFAAQRIYISPRWAQWYFNQQKTSWKKKTKKWFCLEVEFPQNTKQLKYVDFYFYYLIETNNPVQRSFDFQLWTNQTYKLLDHFTIEIGNFYCIYFIIGHFCLNNKSIIMKNVFYFHIFYKLWILLQPCQILTVIFTPTSKGNGHLIRLGKSLD